VSAAPYHGYCTYHGGGYANAYRDARDNILIREETGRLGMPTHVIAGEGAGSSRSETTAYVLALREHGAVGGSRYDWATTGEAGWRVLRNVGFNPRQPAPPRCDPARPSCRGRPVERLRGAARVC